jgi:hypothetical protein
MNAAATKGGPLTVWPFAQPASNASANAATAQRGVVIVRVNESVQYYQAKKGWQKHGKLLEARQAAG